jgi:hypothetical protein
MSGVNSFFILFRQSTFTFNFFFQNFFLKAVCTECLILSCHCCTSCFCLNVSKFQPSVDCSLSPNFRLSLRELSMHLSLFAFFFYVLSYYVLIRFVPLWKDIIFLKIVNCLKYCWDCMMLVSPNILYQWIFIIIIIIIMCGGWPGFSIRSTYQWCFPKHHKPCVQDWVPFNNCGQNHLIPWGELHQYTRIYPNVSGLSHNEVNNNSKHSLRSNTKGYGGKTH